MIVGIIHILLRIFSQPCVCYKHIYCHEIFSEEEFFDEFYADILEKGLAAHSSILSWRISWTEEPGGLQSMGLQRVRHN